MKEYGFDDLYEEFMEFEADSNLFDISVNNIFFWELIRREVYIHIRNQIFDLEDTRSAFNSGQNSSTRNQRDYSIKKYLSSIPDLFPSKKMLLDENVIFYKIADKQMKEGDEKESFISYYFSTVVSDKSVVKEADIPDIEYKYIYDKIIKANRTQANKSYKRHIKLIEDEIKTRFNIDLDITDYTLSCIREFNRNSRVYNMILSLSNTKAIIMRGTNRGLLQACEKQNIPTIQLTQAPTKSHASFEFGSNDINYFSDYLFVPGNSWKSDIDYPIPREDVYAVGNPYHDLKRNEIKRNTGDSILIISQPNLQSRFADLAVKIDRETSMDVILKIHPKANSSKFPSQLLDSPIRVCQDEDLYDLFSKSVVQVGAYSSAVLEGANFGINTVLIDGPWVNSITSHLPDYSYEICGDPAEICSYLDQTTNIVHLDPDGVFLRSSQQKIESAMEDIGIGK